MKGSVWVGLSVWLLLPLLSTDPHTESRLRMVERDIERRGITDARVLAAMRKVPRHLLVPERHRDQAYQDHPLPIGEGQTISQPYVVALMTEALELKPGSRVLEIGTGSGYQAAVLAEIAAEVYSIEIKEDLANRARRDLKRLGYQNVRIKYGDGYLGWAEFAPFDAIIITAAANHIPPPLVKQLKVGGRMILPLGSPVYYQTLTLIEKKKGDIVIRQMGSVRFVPMTGEVRKKKRSASDANK